MIDARAVMAYAIEIARSLAQGRHRAALVVDDIDLADIALEEIYLALLHACRREDGPAMRAREPLLQKLGGARLRRAVSRVWSRRVAVMSSSPPRKAKVVLYPAEPTHVAQLAPVLRVLGDAGLVVAPRLKVAPDLRARGVAAVIAEVAFPGVDATSQSSSSAQSSQSLKSSQSLQSSPGSSSIGASPIVSAADLPPVPPSIDIDAPSVVAVVNAVLARMVPAAAHAVRLARRVLSACSPEVVLVGNDLTVDGRAMVAVARAAGVPSAVAAHGAVLDEVHVAHRADRILVYGEAHRRGLIERYGIDGARVVVTGAPYLAPTSAATSSSAAAHGHLSGDGAQSRIDERIRRALDLADAHRPYVLAAVSNPINLVSHEQHARTMAALATLSTRTDIDVVAKLHRADARGPWDDAVRACPGARLRVVEHGRPEMPASIFEWLAGAALLLTGASSVATEAMSIDVPVVTMDFTGDYAAVDFIEAGATTHVTSSSALSAAVDALLFDARADENRARSIAAGRRFAADYFGERDGRAAERVAACVLSLAGRGAHVGDVRARSASVEGTDTVESAANAVDAVNAVTTGSAS